MRSVPNRSTEDRFFDKVFFCTVTGCWLWTATITSGGYGHFRADRRLLHAHRWSYTHARGPIPQGLVIDHLCRIRNCVNPDHLRAVTGKDNTLAIGSLSPTALNAAKTHCIRGHELRGPNLTRSDAVRGSRACRACNVARSSARHHQGQGRSWGVEQFRAYADKKYREWMST